MSPTLSAIAGSVIGLIGAVLVAVITYATTRHREREAEWRKEKLVYYKAFIESLTVFTSYAAVNQGLSETDICNVTASDRRAVAKASDNLLLFAPLEVIVALWDFNSARRTISEGGSSENILQLFYKLLSAIREDLGVPVTNLPFKSLESDGEGAA